MKATHMIRNTLLTGVCIGLLTGCSWLEDWPPKGSELAVKTAPKPPESKIMQTSGGTWLESDERVSQAGPKGIAVDDASAERIAQLEQTVAGIRNDMQMMMPALTKLAEAQGDLQNALSQVEPAAGSVMGQAAPPSGQGYVQNHQSPQQQRPMPIAAPANTGNNMPPPIPAQFDKARQQQQQQTYQPPQQPSYQQGYQQGYPQQQTYQPQPQQNNGPQPGSVAWYEQQEQQSRQQQAYQPQPQQNNYQRQNYQPPVQQPVMQQASYGGAASGVSVTSVRFGEHPDKTRMVLDTTSDVAFSYNVDASGRMLTVSLPGAGWQGASQMNVMNSPLVSSYNVTPDGAGGHQLVMQMRQPVRVLWAQALKPGGPQGHRIVFDLAAL